MEFPTAPMEKMKTIPRAEDNVVSVGTLRGLLSLSDPQKQTVSAGICRTNYLKLVASGTNVYSHSGSCLYKPTLGLMMLDRVDPSIQRF